MKRLVLILGIVAASFLFFTDDSTNAGAQLFEEKFSVSQAKGESGMYEFDKAHTFIGFEVNHLGLIDVPGHFRDFTGTINYNAEDITKSSVNFSAKIASVETGAAGRDAHLKRADFFDAEKFPEMTFASKKVEKRGDDVYVTGDLTLRGVTKSISFEFDIKGFLPGNERSGSKMGVTADTEINRFDFGVDYGKGAPAGRPGIANKVDIDIRIEAAKAKPATDAAPKTD
jgi:Uncharacterized conserved protein